jgi:uncharacterized protein YraI
MKYARSLTMATAVAGVLAGSQAALAFAGFANSHLNMRAGPGTNYAIVTVINHNDRLEVHGCLKDISWCDVNWGELRGWAAGEYIDVDESDGIKVLPNAGSEIGIPIVTYTAVNAVEPEFVGTVVGVSALVEAVSPPAAVHAYVTEQTVTSVLVTGEVVVGAVVPTTVPLYAVPQSQYSFTRVNGQNVLLNNERKVVYVYR